MSVSILSRDPVRFWSCGRDRESRYVAADLLSQAEHDELASAILITTEEKPGGGSGAAEREIYAGTVPDGDHS